MGFKISWVGFHELSKSEVLDLFGGTDSGIADEANEAPFSIAEIPSGWVVLFSNDFGFVSEEALEALSARGAVVAWQVHEGIMVSAAYCYDRGKQQWALLHNSENGVTDLSVWGELPTAFESVRERLAKEQENNGGDDADVDYFFDIPIETAQALCPYRHDRWKFDWGEPSFTVVNVG